MGTARHCLLSSFECKTRLTMCFQRARYRICCRAASRRLCFVELCQLQLQLPQQLHAWVRVVWKLQERERVGGALIPAAVWVSYHSMLNVSSLAWWKRGKADCEPAQHGPVATGDFLTQVNTAQSPLPAAHLRCPSGPSGPPKPAQEQCLTCSSRFFPCWL